jgi:hypothetical protein
MPGNLPEDFNGVGKPRTPRRQEEPRRHASSLERGAGLLVLMAAFSIVYFTSVGVMATIDKFRIKPKEEDKAKVVAPEHPGQVEEGPSIAAMPDEVTRVSENEALADQIREKEESINALLLQLKSKGEGEGFVFKENPGSLTVSFRDQVGKVGIRIDDSAGKSSFTLNTESVGYDNSNTWDFLVDDNMDGRGLMEAMIVKASDGTENGTLDANPENRAALFLQKLTMLESYLRSQLILPQN